MFKGLIVAHIMIRDGAKDVSLRYLAEQPRYFSTGHIAQGTVSGLCVSLWAGFNSGSV